jgi:hypothetical protein
MDEDLSRAPASVYSSPLFRSATLPNSICARLPSGAVKRNAQTRSICSPFVADRQIEPAAVGVYAGLPDLTWFGLSAILRFSCLPIAVTDPCVLTAAIRRPSGIVAVTDTFEIGAQRTQKSWGPMEWLRCTCERFLLLIEAKANGISAAQELRNRYSDLDCAIPRSSNWSSNRICPLSAHWTRSASRAPRSTAGMT